MEDLVSIVIPSVKRYHSLLRAIDSIRKQTYKNLEIIVVLDGLTNYQKLPSDVITIQLPENTKKKFDYPSPGFCRTMGILKSRGKYIGFLDDDDVYINPNKIVLQIEAMKKTNTRLSCTEALVGSDSSYEPTKTYERYNSDKCYNYIKNIFRQKGKFFNGFPELFNLEFIKTNNSIITSTVLMEKTLLDEIGYMGFVPIGDEDYGCWLASLRYTDCVYISDACIYYYSHS